MSKQTVTVTLSEQDLGDFLEDNQNYMDAYASELQRRLTDYFGSAIVTVDSNTLTDKIEIGDDGDGDDGTVAHIMNQMVNDWDWLPE